MKKLVIVLAFASTMFLSACMHAQNLTPNLGLQLPPSGSTNWNLPLNFNFNYLDQYLGNQAPLPNGLTTTTFNATVGFKINGSFGLAGQVPTSTGSGVIWAFGSGSGLPVNNPAYTGLLTGPQLEGNVYADQWQSPINTGNNGIANSFAYCNTIAFPCSIIAPPLYAQTESQVWGGLTPTFVGGLPQGPTSAQPNATVYDQRYGVPQWFSNGAQPYDSRHNMAPTFSMNTITQPQGLNAQLAPSLYLQNSLYAGGRNFNNNGAIANGDKDNISTLYSVTEKYTQGQIGGDHQQNVNCYGNGDCVGHDIETASYGGPSSESDEGNESMRYVSFEDGRVFGGIVSSVTPASDGSLTVATTSQTFPGFQGEDRILINLTKKYNTGYISQISNGTGNNVYTCVGCNFSSINTSFPTSSQTTLSAAIQNPSASNSFPQTNVNATVGSSVGFTAGQIGCIFDYNYECEKVIAVPDGTHVTFSIVRIPHPVNGYVTTGGLAGYTIEMEADRVGPGALNGISQPADSDLGSIVRMAVPIMMSTATTVTAFSSGYDVLPGHGASYAGRGHTTMGTGGSITLNIVGGAVTSCSASGGSGYGFFNDPPQIGITGTWTTPPQVTAWGNGGTALANCMVIQPGSGISGTPVVTITSVNPYDVYPSGKVWSVFNPSNGQVDGTMFTNPFAVTGAIASSDQIEEPHWFQQHTASGTMGVGQYLPSPSITPHYGLGYNMNGIWQNTDFMIQFRNNTHPSVYVSDNGSNPLSTPWVQGRGQFIPPQGIQLLGMYTNGLFLDTPTQGDGANDFAGSGVIMVGCGNVACSKWTQPYVFLSAENNAFPTQDVLAYTPSISTWLLTAGATQGNGGAPSCSFRFTPAGFNQTGACPTFPALNVANNWTQPQTISVGSTIQNALTLIGDSDQLKLQEPITGNVAHIGVNATGTGSMGFDAGAGYTFFDFGTSTFDLQMSNSLGALFAIPVTTQSTLEFLGDLKTSAGTVIPHTIMGFVGSASGKVMMADVLNNVAGSSLCLDGSNGATTTGCGGGAGLTPGNGIAFAGSAITNTGVTDINAVNKLGLDPTGSVDASSALSTQLNSGSGQSIYFPCGTYKISSPITIAATSTTAENIRLYAQSPDCVVFNLASGDGLWFDNTTSSADNNFGPSIEGIVFNDASGSGAVHSAVRITQYANVDKLDFKVTNAIGIQYQTGTVSSISGTAVVGSGTTWTSAMAGGILWLGGAKQEVFSVNSATSLTLVNPWQGGTTSGSYSLDYNGVGLLLDGGSSYAQYSKVSHSVRAVGVRIGVQALGSQGGGIGTSRFTFGPGFINCNRVPDSIAYWFGGGSDTMTVSAAANNCSEFAHLENAHAILIQGSKFENDGTATVAFGCTPGSPAYSCIMGVDSIGQSGGGNNARGNTVVNSYFYFVGNTITWDQYSTDFRAAFNDIQTFSNINPYNPPNSGTAGYTTATILGDNFNLLQSVTGPATAPSGACTGNAWVFSQDGHGTVCIAGTWTTKI